MGNNYSLYAFLIVLCLAGGGWAQKSARNLATSIGSAFEDRKLSSLDDGKPYIRRFSVTIEHSISGRPSTRSFRSFAAMDAWLTSRERDGLPRRNTKGFQGCRNYVCSFDTMSILHNNLYLKHINTGRRRGKAYAKSIWLLDGD